VRDIEWLEPLVEPEPSQALKQYARQNLGVASSSLGFFASCPWVMRGMIDLLSTKRVHIDHDLTDLVALIVSRDNSCRYCYAASRIIMRLMGMPEDRIRRLEQDLEMAQLDARTKLALDFAARISRSNPPPTQADKNALLESGYSEGAVQELAFVAAENTYHNRISTFPALPPQLPERMANSRFLGLLRPILAIPFRRMRKKGQTEFLSDELKAGPYTYLVLALDGLPAARTLRKILDEAWASPHLSARAKALTFAVVARGLGSSHAEREAFSLLAAEGLGKQKVEEILAHLSSPELDPGEAVMLPYARETIWYEPAAVQRRGREVQKRLTTPQFLELIGIASLANMVCRLAILLDEP
jgi:alkylhydroperoxidase family enzyme